MKKYNILVTGVGAIIGYGIIKSLKNSKYDINIIGMDIYDDAVGQKWCNKFIQAIPAKDENYYNFIVNIIEKNNVDLVFFGTEQEITTLVAEKENIPTSIYSKFVINKSEIVELSKDKWKTYEYLLKKDLPAIKSMIEGTFKEFTQELGLPFLLKPRCSYASKGIVKIYEEEDLLYYRKKVKEDFMVQEIVGDDDNEYTVAIFGIGDGKFINSISLKRKLSQEGSTAKARVVDIQQLNERVEVLTQLLRPIGPTNYQFRFHKGEFLLLETNPRISSSTSIRQAFGYNEAEMCIDFFVNKEIPKKVNIKSGYAIRYIEDVVTIV